MNMPQPTWFRVALTADSHEEIGRPRYADFGLDIFAEQERMDVSRFAEHRPAITPAHLHG